MVSTLDSGLSYQGLNPGQSHCFVFLGKKQVFNYWVIDQAFSVKMAGYWPSSLFACLWTETESRSVNLQKKEWGKCPAILNKKAWSVKDSLFGFWEILSRGTWRVVPSGQDILLINRE